MFVRTDDPVADAERYMAEQDKEMRTLPLCSCCGNPIQTETCFDIKGDLYCHHCMESHYEVSTEDYIK
jgi:hypothetical protein